MIHTIQRPAHWDIKDGRHIGQRLDLATLVSNSGHVCLVESQDDAEIY